MKKILKEKIQKIVLSLLGLKLTTHDYKEFLNWQRNSFLYPVPIFIKMQALNSINKENSYWYDISDKKTEFKNYLSKISTELYIYSDFLEEDKDTSNPNRTNIMWLDEISKFIADIKQKSKENKNIFIFFHSNSSPYKLKYNYHKSHSSQIGNDQHILHKHEYKKVLEKIQKNSQTTLVVDDFDILDGEIKEYLIENYKFKVISNLFIASENI